MKNHLLIALLFISVSLEAQTTFTLEGRPPPSKTIYFGSEVEGVSHFSLHLLIALWRPDYSLVAAVAIELADTANGRFDIEDWGARLTGCFAGYIFKRFLFGNKIKFRFII